MPSLMDMPDVVMSNILEKAELKSILTLQKVCIDLRNFIDDTKPEANLQDIEITVRYSAVEIIYRLCNNRYKIEYQKHNRSEQRCLISFESRYEKKEKLIETSNFVKVFIKDFKLIMGFIGKKSLLKKFEIAWKCADSRDFLRVLKKIEKVLQSRETLKVEKFTMEAYTQEDLLRILPYLDPSSPLELLDIREACLPDCSVLANPMEIEKIVKLKQWKEAEELMMGRHIDVLNMEDFKHFYCVFMEKRTLTKEDLEAVKETFLHLNSTNLREFDIEYKQIQDEKEFFKPFGNSFREDAVGAENEQWFLRIPESSGFILGIMLWEDGSLHVKFMLMDERHIPRGGRIQQWC